MLNDAVVEKIVVYGCGVKLEAQCADLGNAACLQVIKPDRNGEKYGLPCGYGIALVCRLGYTVDGDLIDTDLNGSGSGIG